MLEFKFDIDEEVNNLVFNIMEKRGMFDTEEADIVADFEQFNVKREESGLELVTFEEFLTFIGFDKGFEENTDHSLHKLNDIDLIEDYVEDENSEGVFVGDFSDTEDGAISIVEEGFTISDDDLNLDDLS